MEIYYSNKFIVQATDATVVNYNYNMFIVQGTVFYSFYNHIAMRIFYPVNSLSISINVWLILLSKILWF
jgi:hypothetical protein